MSESDPKLELGTWVLGSTTDDQIFDSKAHKETILQCIPSSYDEENIAIDAFTTSTRCISGRLELV